MSLQRFVEAQEPVYAAVGAELAAGRKRTHWMWFVFPQLRGLGFSPTARHFGLADLAEAQEYLAHAVLGPRLRECTGLVLGHAAGARSAEVEAGSAVRERAPPTPSFPRKRESPFRAAGAAHRQLAITG